MKLGDRTERQGLWGNGLFLSGATILIFLFFACTRLNHDSAWLIEATRRWRDGARLYVDIIEVNPPLIFYEMELLSAGALTKTAYIAGVCAAMAASTLWALRLKGSLAGYAALIACALGGITDFGQRDHLSLVFLIPFLLGDSASRNERIALGVWAFLGAGLKPYLLPIPIAAALARAVMQRSIRPLFSAEMITLGVMCVGYVFAVWLFHRPYLTNIVPLGQFVYDAYGAVVKPQLAALSVVVVITALIPMLLRDQERIPLAAATLAALASFYLQGRNWTYHFIPAVGLGLLLAIWSARQNRGMALLALGLSLGQLARGPHVRRPPSPIPTGVSSVAFLSAHVFAAYPTSLDCGVRNETRYPAIWVVPGAWNIAHDSSRSAADRNRAIHILQTERSTIRGDLLRARPQLIYFDARTVKPYFKTAFDYEAFIGHLPGYRRIGRVSTGNLIYDVWGTGNASVLGPRCDSITVTPS